ncbi:MAG: aminomethyl-transferring glycine dehydrogenase subunit GcvPB, partial [Sulfolobales archaeon]
ESRENIDNLINAYKEIINIAYTNPSEIKRSPQNTSVKRLDTVYGNLPKNIALTYRSLKGKTA